jgi:hypothetical protein
MGMGLNLIASQFGLDEAQAASAEGQSLTRCYLTRVAQRCYRSRAPTICVVLMRATPPCFALSHGPAQTIVFV